MLELNKLILGDCLNALQDIPDGSIDLIVTDQPYFLPSWTGGGFMDETHDRWKDEINQDNLAKSYDISAFAEIADRIQGGKINAYFFCNKLQIPQYFDEYVNKRGCKFDILCWHKDNAMPTFHNKYLTDTEYLLYFRKSGCYCNPQSYNDAKTWFVQSINNKDKQMYGHPTIKPLNIVQTIIRNSSEYGGVILDPFCGSGTTAIAAIREKRHWICIEKDPKFYEVAKKRIENELKQPTLF